MTIIDCVSDLHGHFPEMEGGDLLLIAGDLTATDTPWEYIVFYKWLHNQKYKHYIIIGGNHDNLLQEEPELIESLSNTTYLCDSGMEFQGIKIWGSPWTKTFKGMNPRCKAFTVDTDEELAEKWSLIPDDVDVLITHSPAWGVLDDIRKYGPFSHERLEHAGSMSLLERMVDLKKLKLHVFGHIHENGGQCIIDEGVYSVNASIMNEVYEPVNKPIRIIL